MSRLTCCNQLMRLAYRSLLLILLSAPAITLAEPEEATIQRAYPVPEHGEIILNVPANWEVTYFSPGELKPPVITFYKKDKSQGELFQLNISTLWDDGFERDITRPEEIRALVEETGMNILESSKEEDLKLIPFKGTQGEGYYFVLSDKSARPGEYEYLMQGAVSVGEILVVFSLFTREPDSTYQAETLKMLMDAMHKLQRHL